MSSSSTRRFFPLLVLVAAGACGEPAVSRTRDGSTVNDLDATTAADGAGGAAGAAAGTGGSAGGGGSAGADAGAGAGGGGGGGGAAGGATGAGGSNAGGTTGGGGTSTGGTTGSGGFLGAGGGSPTTTVIGGPVVRVDFDMQGRPTSETTEIGYTAWAVTSGTSVSSTFQGITFTMAKAGSNGTGLKSDWQKVAVQIPNYARLVGDGLTVEGGEAGAQIQMTIRGLSAGKHSILVYLNQTANVASVAPVDILVGGTVKATVTPSIQALSNAAAKTAYLVFDATAGQDVVILFRAQSSSSAANKNVMINGFDLNVYNLADQATNPSPANGDEHVDCDSGSVTLSWKAAAAAASHDIYVGTDLASVTSATRSSPTFRGNVTGATSYKLTGINSLKTYYWRIDEITAQNAGTPGTVWYFRPRHLAFPAAEGYGRFARGGRGGVVVHVTNLNDSGAGSLRAAVETDVGPRVIVFDVSGIIKLASRLSISQSYITVAGQTSPGKGIVIRSAPFGATGARDLIIQNVRVRLGGGATFDGMGLQGSDHSIVDHCSISWTIDEAFSSRSAKNITLQRTLISEALNVAGHVNYPAGTAHGYAGSISGDLGSFHHNLLAHCEGRNWSLAGGLDGAGYFSGRLDIFSTVVYNWGGRTTDGGAHQVNFVNNYYRPGPSSDIFTALNAQYDNFPGTQQYYCSGNVMPGHFDETTQSKGCVVTSGPYVPTTYKTFVTAPFFPSYAKIDTARDAFKNVLSDVGCVQPVLDDHDVRVIKETLNGTTTYKGSVSGKAGLPDNEADVGGYESYPAQTRAATWDSDGDGLPDFWENQIGSNPSSPAKDFSDSNADPDGDGYTQLDDYLQWMAVPHYFTSPGTAVNIDLAKTFVGFTSSPVYSSSNVVNGAVTISGTTATFKATRCGFASWKLTVKDSAGTTMTKDMVAFASAASGSSCP